MTLHTFQTMFCIFVIRKDVCKKPILITLHEERFTEFDMSLIEISIMIAASGKQMMREAGFSGIFETTGYE